MNRKLGEALIVKISLDILYLHIFNRDYDLSILVREIRDKDWRYTVWLSLL